MIPSTPLITRFDDICAQVFLEVLALFSSRGYLLYYTRKLRALILNSRAFLVSTCYSTRVNTLPYAEKRSNWTLSRTVTPQTRDRSLRAPIKLALSSPSGFNSLAEPFLQFPFLCRFYFSL